MVYCVPCDWIYKKIKTRLDGPLCFRKLIGILIWFFHDVMWCWFRPLFHKRSHDNYYLDTVHFLFGAVVVVFFFFHALSSLADHNMPVVWPAFFCVCLPMTLSPETQFFPLYRSTNSTMVFFIYFFFLYIIYIWRSYTSYTMISTNGMINGIDTVSCEKCNINHIIWT